MTTAQWRKRITDTVARLRRREDDALRDHLTTVGRIRQQVGGEPGGLSGARAQQLLARANQVFAEALAAVDIEAAKARLAIRQAFIGGLEDGDALDMERAWQEGGEGEWAATVGHREGREREAMSRLTTGADLVEAFGRMAPGVGFYPEASGGQADADGKTSASGDMNDWLRQGARGRGRVQIRPGASGEEINEGLRGMAGRRRTGG